MKTAYAVTLCIVALFLSACVTGDEITSYVIDPQGSIEFSIYRHNLTSSEVGEDAQKDLANYIQSMNEKSDRLFAKLMAANAQEVNVALLRRASPASVLITGRIRSLNDFAVYLSEKEDSEHLIVCTPISKERVEGIQCELIRKPSNEKLPPDTVTPQETQSDAAAPSAAPLNVTRFALAEGSFTKTQGFLLAPNKRSAVLDESTLSKMWDSGAPSITFSLEWQSPEAR
jgi:hypothetical protein